MQKQKHALVTGGTRGIGAGISSTLKQAGYKVTATYHGNDERAQSFQKEFGVCVHKWDVSDFEACQSNVDLITKTYGPVDILINNAGITRDGLVLRMSEADFDDVIRINLKGAFNCSKAVLRHMFKARQGRIINMSSVIGLIGNLGQANYAASKAGIIGLTKSLAKEVASRNITVNAIAPGFIETPMTEVLSEEVRSTILKQIPVGRFGKVEDVAHCAIFLASEQANYINGQVIQVDGGMVM